MEKRSLTVCLLLVVLVLFITPSYGADNLKIGIVDFQKLFEESDAGKGAKAEINAQGEKMAAELKKKHTEIEELKKQLERESMVGKKEALESKEREYRIKVGDFKDLEQKYNKDFKELNAKVISKIQAQVMGHIDEIGKKEGYNLILEKREAGVLFAPNQSDLTDKLIKLINLISPQKKSK